MKSLQQWKVLRNRERRWITMGRGKCFKLELWSWKATGHKTAKRTGRRKRSQNWARIYLADAHEGPCQGRSGKISISTGLRQHRPRVLQRCTRFRIPPESEGDTRHKHSYLHNLKTRIRIKHSITYSSHCWKEGIYIRKRSSVKINTTDIKKLIMHSRRNYEKFKLPPFS